MWDHLFGGLEEEALSYAVLYIMGASCVSCMEFSADYDGKESELNHEPSGYLGQGGGR